MNDLEKDIYNFIRDKDIDFYQEVININLNIDNYQFTLTSELFDDGYEMEIHIDFNLLKNYYEFIELSNDFKEEVAMYFEAMINYSEEHLIYLLRLTKCLSSNDIDYLA